MLEQLEPKALWHYFEKLNAVPRPSKKEERVIAFMLEFGKQLGLQTEKDQTGNVIIRKPATAGMEGRPIVCLQSHLDMVHQKNADSDFDFNSQGIQMQIEGDWVRAKGTTLGADNGIGVASIMAILAADNIAHPPLEALFTIDEETGMTGALNLQAGRLKAKYLLNLDTEDDEELTIGCAGGADVTASGKYKTSQPAAGSKAFLLTVRGLTGGHSGMDIHLGRANANKLMNRLLWAASGQFQIQAASIDGGGLRNAIPRESVAELVLPAAHEAAFVEFIKAQAAIFHHEYALTDPHLALEATPCSAPATVLSSEFQAQLLAAVYACQNGIYRMSPDVDRLVQTSNNLARVLVKDGSYLIQCLTRGSVDSEKMDLAETLKACFHELDAAVSFSGLYPGWTPNPSSALVTYMSELYKQFFGHEAKINAVHAGLECGILGNHYPDMQMISFGPNIRGAHSPDEKVQISSVQKFWGYLLEALKQMPK